MEASEFWDLIEASAREADSGESDSGEARARWLVTQLAARPVQEIVGFEQRLDEQTTAAMTWLMWSAADRIMGWCSEDSFIDFRAWLVGLGRNTFQAVLGDVDSLAEVPQIRRLAGRYHGDWAQEEWPAWESLEYAASHAYERVTGDKDGFYGLVPQPEGEILTDERWDFGDPRQAARRLPKLARLFPREER